jgi:hypothetical protein
MGKEVEVLRGIRICNGLEKILAEILPPRPFSAREAVISKVKEAFPDLPEDTVAEVGKLVESRAKPLLRWVPAVLVGRNLLEEAGFTPEDLPTAVRRVKS